ILAIIPCLVSRIPSFPRHAQVPDPLLYARRPSLPSGNVIDIFVPLFVRLPSAPLAADGQLLTSKRPPSRATPSRIPERPNESRRASASSTLNPIPSSSTVNLTNPSAELAEMFTLVALECLPMLLQHSCTRRYKMISVFWGIGPRRERCSFTRQGCSRLKRFTSCRSAAPSPSCSRTAG